MNQKTFLIASIFLFYALCSASSAAEKSCPDGNNSRSKQNFSKGFTYEEITCSNGTKLLIERKLDKNAKKLNSPKTAAAGTSAPPKPKPEKLFLNEQVDLESLLPQRFYDSEEKRLIKKEDKSNTSTSNKSGQTINDPLSVDSKELESWNPQKN